MKTLKTIFTVMALTIVSVGSMSMSPLSAVNKITLGGNQLLCSITVNGSTAVTTSSNVACNWAKGQQVLMQCPSTSVYINSTTTNGSVTAATTSHQRVDFNLGITDPIVIPMLSNDRVISVLGTGAGTCNFFLGGK